MHNSGARCFSELLRSACSLAQIRKMGPAVQINIAKKQINTMEKPQP
jgi:hypothetical protein